MKKTEKYFFKVTINNKEYTNITTDFVFRFAYLWVMTEI